MENFDNVCMSSVPLSFLLSRSPSHPTLDGTSITPLAEILFLLPWTLLAATCLALTPYKLRLFFAIKHILCYMRASARKCLRSAHAAYTQCAKRESRKW